MSSRPTFGARCSSGAFFSFRHADPHGWSASGCDVGCAGIAAVDFHLGATQEAETRDRPCAGAHVLEEFVSGDLVCGQPSRYDCYPRRNMPRSYSKGHNRRSNPRNAYQRTAATNTTDGHSTPTWAPPPAITVNLLLGKGPRNRQRLAPGSSEASPIFLAGTRMIVSEGTQLSAGTGVPRI